MSLKELLSLALRCEQANGSDRDLDVAIARSMGWEVVLYRRDGKPYYEPIKGYSWQLVPAYSGSLDKAVALAPEGCDWHLMSDGSCSMGNGTGARFASLGCETPALALCAASLRARAQTPEQLKGEGR